MCFLLLASGMLGMTCDSTRQVPYAGPQQDRGHDTDATEQIFAWRVLFNTLSVCRISAAALQRGEGSAQSEHDAGWLATPLLPDIC